MTRSDDLANEAESQRGKQEHRVAAAHAVRDLIRTGGAPPARIVEALIRRGEKRLDGTQITTRDTTPEKRRTTTNHADGITSGYAPLSGRED